MASLADLPNELLCEILKVIWPQDLENFAQTSKHVLLVSKPFLEEHRRLIRLYKTFNSAPPLGQSRHTDGRDGWSVGPVPTLFKDICHQPRLAHYVNEVKLDVLLEFSSVYLEFEKDKVSDERRRRHKQHRDLVDTVVAQSDVPEVRDQHERYQRKYHGQYFGGEELLMALLLPLLPNLRSLSMELNSQANSYFFMMIQHSARVGMPWLANLTTLCLGRLDDVSSSIGLNDLALFNSLPSLQSLTAFRVDDGEHVSVDYFSPSQNSHITDLKLLHTEVSPKRLYRYLESFQALQNFAFEPEFSPYSDYEGSTFDLCWIRNALMTSAKATLQTLTILGPPCSYTFMGSFQTFGALREISTDWCFIFDKYCDFETRPSQVLPASLQRLKVRYYGYCPDEELKSFFRGIRQARTKICLHLEMVDIWWDCYSTGDRCCGPSTAREEARKAAWLEHLNGFCRELGMSLTFPEAATSSGSHEYRLSLTFNGEN